MRIQSITGQRIRRVASVAVASTFLTQNFAWAVCSDGLGFPAGQTSYVQALLPPDLANFNPHVFTGTAGSFFIPDNSVCENNSGTVNGLGADGVTPLTGGQIGRPCIGQPELVAKHGSGLGGRNDPTVTVPTTIPQIPVGGHDWVADQGSDTCKMQEVGPADQPATSWNIPPNTVTDCVVTPVVKIGAGGFPQLFNFMVAPLQVQPLMLPCDPTKLSTLQQFDALGNPIPGTGPNINNTRINQLACAVSEVIFGQVTASTQDTGPAYLFVAGIQGGLFAQRLAITANTSTGDAGRTISEFKYYGDIPTGQKLTNAMVSNDGHFAGATSIRRNPNLFVCNNPLGDAGRIDQPIPPISTFILTQDSTTPNLPQGVKCLTSAASTGLAVTLSNYWAPDNQPYLGGQRTVTTAGGIGSLPGGYFQTNNWPQCIVNGKGIPVTLPAIYPSENSQFGNNNAAAALDAAIKTVFQNHSNGGCGTFGANAGFAGTAVIQPQSLTGYVTGTGQIYMFTAGVAQPVVQAKLTRDAVGQTHYSIRTYLQNGTGFTTGLGVASAMSFDGTGSHDTAGNPTPNPAATGSGSLIVMTDSSGIGLAGQEVMTRVPLCEDF